MIEIAIISFLALASLVKSTYFFHFFLVHKRAIIFELAMSILKVPADFGFLHQPSQRIIIFYKSKINQFVRKAQIGSTQNLFMGIESGGDIVLISLYLIQMQFDNSPGLLNLLLKEELDEKELHQALETKHKLPKKYPKQQIISLVKKIKPQNYIQIESIYKQIINKYKHPGLHYSSLGLLLLSSIVIMSNSAQISGALGIMAKTIEKLSWYVAYKDQKGEFQMIFYQMLEYLNGLMSVLLPAVFENNQYQQLLTTIHMLMKGKDNNIKTIGELLLVVKVKSLLQTECQKGFIFFILSLTKPAHKYALFSYIFQDRSQLNLLLFNKILHLRSDEGVLDKHFIKILPNKKLVFEPAKSRNLYPNWIESAYKVQPKELPVNLKISRKFTQYYNLFLQLEIWCTSPFIECLNQYFQEQLQLLQQVGRANNGQKIANSTYKFRKQKIKNALRDIQKQITTDNSLKGEIKQLVS